MLFFISSEGIITFFICAVVYAAVRPSGVDGWFYGFSRFLLDALRRKFTFAFVATAFPVAHKSVRPDPR